ncbi:glyoxal oxidase N-terminus-domain-containing protein [Roridomyces roridus]|uniref:Glyoxal oxidase N-terminus-domain-containing protein n=1 Tax=Roridomyces roridus TaxID=1738132 RepID=A0AAD7FSQ5_9AGAR|nr:glyoxal oxidase N-terminus-domain-containing protein [Roridomyces roridus]
MHSSKLFSLLPFLRLAIASADRTWTFVQQGNSGIVPLELITLSPTLALMYDRPYTNPLKLPDGEPAWAGLWHFDTNTATPLKTITNTFCAGGAFISNGTLVAVGGQPLDSIPGWGNATDGTMGIRLFGPCTSKDGTGPGCTVFEDPKNMHLAVTRWYPTALRIPDGSLMIMGGSDILTTFNSADIAQNNIEFFPPRKGEKGKVRPSKFLNDTLPANLFPRSMVLPSGHVLMMANNQSVIYDIETNKELHRLPELPNGVRIGVPFDGFAQLLPLSPPLYEPTVLACGGSNKPDTITLEEMSIHDVASTQCQRMTLTSAGIAAGWQVEHMPEPRLMPETVILPTGDVLILNGAHSGYSGYPSVGDSAATGSNAANPALRGIMYRTSLPHGQRLTQAGLPASSIPRMYHSAATFTAKGNVMVAASNPHPFVLTADNNPNNQSFPTEYRVEYLNPDFITHNSPRPVISHSPSKLAFNAKGTITVTIPRSLASGELQVSLMDMGFITHGWHAGSRLVFLEHKLKGNQLTITAPPNGNIYPPGPAWIYVVADGVWSEGVQIMIGDGGNPPRPSQGVPAAHNCL